MGLVEGEDATGSQAASQYHDREVGEAEVQIGVAAVELGGGMVLRVQARRRIAARGKVGEKGPTGGTT